MRTRNVLSKDMDLPSYGKAELDWRGVAAKL
jgi:hypothetical protein